MLNAKERLILKTLYESQHTYVTGQELAAQLQISDRTVRKYISQLGSSLTESGGKIVSKTGQGYRLCMLDNDQFFTFYQHEIKEGELKFDITSIHASEDRQYFILNRLFFERSQIFVDDVAEELFVSRSTISNDLVEVKKLLAPYELELKSKTKTGIYISGSEQNKRHFMMNYFFMDRLQDNLYTFSKYAELLAGVRIEEIVIIVLNECRESKLKLSDFIIFNIVLHIGLAIKRIKSGFKIKVSEAFDADKNSLEYLTAMHIIQRIEEVMDVQFPIAEASYIALHLRNKRAFRQVLQENDYSEKEMRHELVSMLRKIDKKTGFAFHQDSILINGLLMHFTPLLTRLKNHTSIENPLLLEIKQKYPHIFALTLEYFAKMELFKNYEVTESEWAYLTLHLSAAMERFFNEQKTHVIVICATGLGSSQMLKTRIEHELGSKIIVDHVLGYYEISEEMLKDVELIISSISLPRGIPMIPVVHVSVFLDQQDIQRINQELTRIKKTDVKMLNEPNLENENSEEIKELIDQCFQADLFLHLKQKTTKKEVLEQLLDRIDAIEPQAVKEKLSKQLRLRESYHSVAFSSYLAVPHPLEGVTQSACAEVAVVPEGVYWDNEHPAIQLVFLSSPDYRGSFPIEKVNRLFVEIIENDDYRKALSQCKTFQEFMKIFSHC